MVNLNEHTKQKPLIIFHSNLLTIIKAHMLSLGGREQMGQMAYQYCNCLTLYFTLLKSSHEVYQLQQTTTCLTMVMLIENNDDHST